MCDSAFEAGRKAGRGDRYLNHRSDYAWFGMDLDPQGTYSFEYSRGYRAGWNFR